MRLRDLTLTEFNNAFKRMAEPYYLEYLTTVGRKPDWVDGMVWSKLESTFRHKVEQGIITGSEANTRYWIRLFRKDIRNVDKFLTLVED